jgi:von Willebrand factor type A domain
MPGRRRQFWRAVGISLACHALAAGVFFLTLPAGRSARVAAVPALDLKIPAPENFVPISFQFDAGAPAPRTEASIAPAKPVAEPPPKPDDPKNDGPLQNVTPAAYQTTSPVAPSPTVESGGPPSVGPLHGKIVDPSASIVYVLDRSGSMAQEKKLSHAVALLKASLTQLGPGIRFQIVTYDSLALPFRLAGNLSLAPASAKNIADAGKLLDGLVAEGSSRHVEGLQAGLALQPDFLILLTDAGDLSSTDVKRIKQWNLKGTSIHAFLIGVDVDVATLRELADVHFVPLPAQSFLTP